MNREIKLLIQNCLPFQAPTLKNCQKPLKMTELPSGSWEHIVVDFKEPLPSGDYLLVVIDEYSRFVEIEITKSTSMKSSIPKLDEVFFSFDIPLKVKSDNGSLFDCGDFDKYAKYLGFIHHHITPAYPQANGLVENLNRTTSNLLCTYRKQKLEARTLEVFKKLQSNFPYYFPNLLRKYCFQAESLIPENI